MNLQQAFDILFSASTLQVEQQEMSRVEECHRFLVDFAASKVIYGINTGFGPMAQWRVDDAHLKDLQYNIIRSHATGMGEPLSPIQVKAAMLVRYQNFMQARSGIHPEVPLLLREFINRDIIPFIPSHGSVGASGDLVQLAHIALTMIGEGKVLYKGEWRATAEVLEAEGLKPINIYVREGLSMTNGTSVMTGISLVNQYAAQRLLQQAIVASVWLNEVVESYDDWMAAQLNAPRRQPGQQTIAAQMREIAAGSQLLRRREHELYDPANNGARYFEHKVQAYYSLRCTPQILGPIFDTLQAASVVLENELNSASDNPIVDPVSQNVYHGGNFHGDYISLEQDKVKIAMVRLAMVAERQLNYLFHDKLNGLLPPFLNMGTLGLNYGMQACQFTATSTTAECQTLAMPNYVHSIPNNNDNQDVVSMGTNTALLTARVIENVTQVMSILYLALAQATDCRNIADKLAQATRHEYDMVRSLVPSFVNDEPFYPRLQLIENYLKHGVTQP